MGFWGILFGYPCQKQGKTYGTYGVRPRIPWNQPIIPSIHAHLGSMVRRRPSARSDAYHSSCNCWVQPSTRGNPWIKGVFMWKSIGDHGVNPQNRKFPSNFPETNSGTFKLSFRKLKCWRKHSRWNKVLFCTRKVSRLRGLGTSRISLLQPTRTNLTQKTNAGFGHRKPQKQMPPQVEDIRSSSVPESGTELDSSSKLIPSGND